MKELWIPYAGIAGAVFASFLDTWLGRHKAHVSIVWPLSRCDSCGHRLGFWELAPIISYLLHWGKCRYCGARYGSKTLVWESIGAMAGMILVVLV